MKKYNLYLLISVLSVFLIAFCVRSQVTINISHSLPRGLYWLTEVKEPEDIEIGDIVLFDTPEKAKKYIYGRGYQNRDVKQILKMVAATEKDQITKKDSRLYINGFSNYRFLMKDSLGNPLPQLSTEELQPHEGDLFVIGTHYRSFDSRYYGVIKRSNVKATAKLLIKF